MAEPPAPDLHDRAGRLIRFLLAVLVGVAIGIGVYIIASALIEVQPDKLRITSRQMSRFTFVIWLSMLSGVVSFFVTLLVQNRIVRKKWEAKRLPQARVL